MKIDALTRKSHFWNEDRFILGNNYYLVIDGATPLIKNKGHNLACYMVKYIKKNIHKYNGSIKTRLEMLSSDIYKSLKTLSDDTAYLPSASLSYVEDKGDEYEIGIVGDCEAVVKKVDGEIIRCYDDSLSKLDDFALSKMIEIAKEKNIDIVDARPFINDILIENRRLQNKENGYNAYTVLPNFSLNELKFKFKKSDVTEIYLYSDGFSDAFTSLGIYSSYEEMFKNSIDIKEEVNKIKLASYNDSKCNKNPRFKVIDDITIVKIVK